MKGTEVLTLSTYNSEKRMATQHFILIAILAAVFLCLNLHLCLSFIWSCTSEMNFELLWAWP